MIPQAGDPGLSRVAEALRCAGVLGQAALLWLLLEAFQLESEAFRRVVLAALIAFPVHHYLPARFRLPFFTALSAASVFLVLGWAHGACLLGLAGALIGLCHLPIRFAGRVALLVALGGLLAAVRGGWLAVPGLPWLKVVLPILGAMFMFRLILYLYELSHTPEPLRPWRAFAYFLMLPNVCSLLFPVVDYRTFCRSHFDGEPFRIYQVGLRWIQRGAVQLILYRLVYQFVQVDPTDVSDATTLFRHVFATFLLYLQVSGIFHLIAGLLRLYGFNLPETHHLYYLASSLTDLWRRINIYWKDFTTKVIFYPVVLRLRRLGQVPAMLIGTLVTFLATWLLHSWQWFWLRGSFLFSAADFAFWAVLGLLVTINVGMEWRAAARQRTRPRAARGAHATARLAARTVATFLFMSLLWSMWSSESIGEWLELMRFAGEVDARALLLLALVAGAIAIGAVLRGRTRATSAVADPAFAFWPAALRGAAVTTATGLLALTTVQSYMPAETASVLRSIEKPHLSRRDRDIMQRGYYEDLIQVGRFSPELEAIFAQKPQDWFAPWLKEMTVRTDDYLETVLVPSKSMDYLGVRYTTNRWGMRDREYALDKPPGTRRIAVLGASNSLGWGVGDDETCEQILEDRLNREAGGGGRWESLNFSVIRYGPTEKLITLEANALRFSPDIVIYEGHRADKHRVARHLADNLRLGLPVPYPEIVDLARRAGVDRDTSPALAVLRMNRQADEALDWVFRRIVSLCRERGITPIYIFFPEASGLRHFDQQIPAMIEMARAAGFAVIDLTPAIAGVPHSELRLAGWDDHLNARGHRLLADYLFERLSAAGAIAPADPRSQ